VVKPKLVIDIVDVGIFLVIVCFTLVVTNHTSSLVMS
jgi:hypothetical protein